MAQNICQSVFRILPSTEKILNKFVKFCPSGEISRNLVTLNVCETATEHRHMCVIEKVLCS